MRDQGRQARSGGGGLQQIEHAFGFRAFHVSGAGSITIRQQSRELGIELRLNLGDRPRKRDGKLLVEARWVI